MNRESIRLARILGDGMSDVAYDKGRKASLIALVFSFVAAAFVAGVYVFSNIAHPTAWSWFLSVVLPIVAALVGYFVGYTKNKMASFLVRIVVSGLLLFWGVLGIMSVGIFYLLAGIAWLIAAVRSQ